MNNKTISRNHHTAIRLLQWLLWCVTCVLTSMIVVPVVVFLEHRDWDIVSVLLCYSLYHPLIWVGRWTMQTAYVRSSALWVVGGAIGFTTGQIIIAVALNIPIKWFLVGASFICLLFAFKRGFKSHPLTNSTKGFS